MIREIFLYTLGTVILFGPFVVLVLKGRKWHCLWTFVPVIGHLIITVMAFRIAKHTSRWAGWFYDERKMAVARDRYYAGCI